jgi:enamine deaminase RidA (YjgF/YER057c/UK114 family)
MPASDRRPTPLPTPSVTAVGPYSPAVRAGDWIVCSGQIGVDPATGSLVDGGIVAQARQALANVATVLADCGCGWQHVAKAGLFVAPDGAPAMPEINATGAQHHRCGLAAAGRRVRDRGLGLEAGMTLPAAQVSWAQ